MTIKQLNEIIEQGMSLKMISQAYTEIASNKLKQIRDQVERNRQYLASLSEVYQVVKQVALQRKLIKPPKFNKPISLLITSNYHFYGNVNHNLIKFFALQQVSSEQIVIGKTALEWLKSNHYSTPFTQLVLTEDYPSDSELETIVAKVKDYSQIFIYYSELKTVMIQTPTVTDITQNSLLKPLDPTGNSKENGDVSNIFIFEPELNKILDFFSGQVTNLLLQQTFLESELSRTASRLVSMDQAQSNADKYILDQRKSLAQAKRSITNSKLLQTFTALSQLRKAI